MLKAIKKYLAYTKLFLYIGTAYKWQVIWGFFTGGIIVLFNMLLWHSIYINQTEIGGFNYLEIINYIIIAQILFPLTSVRIDRDLGRSINRGQILNRLIRPVNLYLEGLFKNIGLSLWKLVLSGLPILLVSLLLVEFHIVTLGVFLNFTIAVCIAFIISYNLNFIAGISAVWLQGSEGIMHAKDFLIMVCAGTILPLSFYPEVFQKIFSYLPFKYVTSVPVNIYLEKSGYTDNLALLLEGLGWIAILNLINHLVYKKALGKLTFFGG